ncbi:MAG: choice-of-anchor Q domain-containing protein, partial [Solirubrobacteraceae bacterium]
ILSGDGSAQTAFLNVAFPITVEDLELEDGSAASTPSGSGGDLDDEPTSTNATLTVQDVLVLDGQAADGGGIYFGQGSTLRIVDSEIVDNSIPSTLATASGYGAGLFTEADSETEILRSTVSDNSDDGGPGEEGGGAGISNSGADLFIQDSTIAGNTCSSVCNGTALRVGLGTSHIFGGTIAASSANASSALYAGSDTELEIGGSIVTGNADYECAVNSAPTAGQIVDEGYNVADDTTCGFSGTSHQGLSDQAVGLGPLTENGGATPTMQVTSSSAAYDIVPTGKQLSHDDTDFCSRYDERGMDRAQTRASACSAGAYQFAPPSLSLVVPSSDEAGRTVTIAGSNLQYALVTFGSGDAPGTVTSPSPTEITATVPILGPGSQPITVTNADGSAQLPFTLLANPQVTTASLPDAERGVAYTGQLDASGGAPPLTWTASSPLPAGLTLSANGVIAGTPTAAGGPFDVAVSDSNGVTANQSLQITVVPAVAIVTSSLRSAVAGVPYGADL